MKMKWYKSYGRLRQSIFVGEYAPGLVSLSLDVHRLENNSAFRDAKEGLIFELIPPPCRKKLTRQLQSVRSTLGGVVEAPAGKRTIASHARVTPTHYSATVHSDSHWLRARDAMPASRILPATARRRTTRAD